AKDPKQRFQSARDLEAALALIEGTMSEGASGLVPTSVCSHCGAECDLASTSCAKCGGAIAAEGAEAVPTDSDELSVGTVVGSYRLLEPLGEGGMGRVYRAEHTRLGRKVALKMLRQELAGNRSAVQRFFTEARAVNRICHEHIVEITDLI